MTGKFAIVTGASTGIGLELARCCAKDGHDLLIAADEAAIEDAASLLRQEKSAANIQALEADLATMEGGDKLVAAAARRPVDLLIANAGRGLAMPSSIRNSGRSGKSSIRTSSAQPTSCTRSLGRCAMPMRGAF